MLLALVAAVASMTLQTNARADGRDAPALIPRPAMLEVVRGAAPFAFSERSRIVVPDADAETEAVGQVCAAFVAGRTVHKPPVVTLSQAMRRGDLLDDVWMRLDKDLHAPLGDEGYRLIVGPRQIEIVAARAAGLFYGVQTLAQLLEQGGPGDGAGRVHALRIQDKPRYAWRGMLLDCGRHCMDKAFIKRYIDLLAYHKMNVLHWHLTEDQGWRIEIRKYPELTRVGAWRSATRPSEQPRDAEGRYGGYYTQADVKEIVAYARRRYVTVVPEIEMPGHALAALASYPKLGCRGEGYQVGTTWGVYDDVFCAGNDEVFAFLEDVLLEVIELFPSPYIHVGGDECPKERWKTCEKCQARIRAEGLAGEVELQSDFIGRIDAFLYAHGRRLIGWDEILEGGLAPHAVVQSWRGMDGANAAASAGHDVVVSPTSHCYLDYAQIRMAGEPTNMGFIPLERCYALEPTPAALTPEQARHVLGLEGNMWTEHAPQDRVDWQVFPRLCALAEVAWTPERLRDWPDFQERLSAHYPRLDARGVTYFIEPPACSFATPPEEGEAPAWRPVPADGATFEEAVLVRLSSPFGPEAVRFTLDGREPTKADPRYADAIRLTASTVLSTRTLLANGRSSRPVTYRFRLLTPEEAAARRADEAFEAALPRLRIEPAKLPTPTPQQLAWQEMEMHAFVHFGMNTFTNREWGDGTEDPQRFNPTAFDARQWARVLKETGFKQIIITAKHHDGFCLWPSAYTDHSVKRSPWRDGRGDVVGEVAACREFGLKFGVYLSPWDRHEPTYGDSPGYNAHYLNQLRELLTNYGPVHEVWFDGACGEGPGGKRQVYDWPGYIALIRELAPDAVIFSDAGPDVRWVGNEQGFAGQTCWSTLHRDRFHPGTPEHAQLVEGHIDGTHWVPAECDVSIRPGWFHHPEQDGQVKPLRQLLDIYYNSVGRNGVLLLNVPPDARGLLHESDVARLRELRDVLDETFAVNLALGRTARAGAQGTEPATTPALTDADAATFWAAPDGAFEATIEIDLGSPVVFDRVGLQEAIRHGQRIAGFRVDAWDGLRWLCVARGTTVGYKRLLRIEPVTASRVRVVILDALAPPALCEIALFKASPRESA